MGSNEKESSNTEIDSSVNIVIFDAIIPISSIPCLDNKDVSCLLLGTNIQIKSKVQKMKMN